MASACLAAVVFVLYWISGRRALHLLFAGWLLCAAAYGLLAAVVGNLVPDGQRARAVPEAALATLRWVRAVVTLAPISLAINVHLVLLYTGARNFVRRHIAWVYGACLAAAALVWSPWLFAARDQPMAETAGWACVAPWAPHIRPGVVVLYGLWAAALVYSLAIVWPYARSVRPASGGFPHRARLVRLALLVLGGSVLVDMATGCLGWCTPRAGSLGSLVTGMFLAIAIIQEAADREREVARLLAAAGPEGGAPPAAGAPRGPDDRATAALKTPLVFIAAKSADYRAAEEVCRFLETHGVRAFFSQESLPRLGDSDYRMRIDDAIDAADHMLVVASKPEHVTAPWVMAEWGLFINEKRSGRKTGNLITVLVGDLTVAQLPASLRYYQAIRLGPGALEEILAYVRHAAE
jgi:hypothetical protein